MTPPTIILDVDTGIDDAWAIYLAHRSPGLTLKALTTTFGNSDIETTTRNTLLIRDLLGSQVPVYRGSGQPLYRPWDGPVPAFHGENGLGDAPLPPVNSAAESLEAAEFLIKTIRQHPHEITLVMVARLTNLARALLYDPSLAPLIPHIVLMGGAAFVPGNVTAVAEANIWGDPEAADIVFRSGIPITMVGLDVTMTAELTRDDLSAWKEKSAFADLMRKATEFYIQAYEKEHPDIQSWCPIHDALAVAVAEDPSLVQGHHWPVRVESQGLFTQGMTVVDARRADASSSVLVGVSLDVERFHERFVERLL